MGLDQFKQSETSVGAAHFRSFGKHEAEDVLNDMADDLQERFPEEVQIDFIEVSTSMTKCHGKAYRRERNGEWYQYIRIAERHLIQDDDRVKLTLAHEMCHLYLYQNGYSDITEKSPMFSWILGRVGASVTDIGVDSDMWQDLAEPMLED